MSHSLCSTVARKAEPPTHVFTEHEAVSLGERLLTLGNRTRIEHVSRVSTKIANGRVLLHDDGTQLAVNVYPRFSTASQVGSIFVSTSYADERAIEAVLARASALVHGGAEASVPSARPEQYSFVPVSLWHESTVRAMTDARRDAVEQILTACAKANLQGAATVGIVERSVAYMTNSGLTAYCRETDAELTVTVRLPDGTSSGWAGQATRDWTRMDVGAVVTQAIELARRGAKPQALEPGRRMAILAPGAVVQLMRHLAPSFDAASTDRGKTPLSRTSHGGNKLGQPVVDPRLSMISDPNDPEGGFPPFFELSDDLSTIPGLPVPVMRWIDRGVLKNLAYDQSYGLMQGKPYSTKPYSIRMGTSTPTQETATIEEMIAGCEDGVYVNRFSNVELVDAATGMLTGVTRDGCFLIKNGKIDRPVKNFRFLDSPLLFLNRVERIGVEHRAAFGYTPPSMDDAEGKRTWPPIARVAQWPRLPVIVPALMVRDFNFSALSDAV